MSRAYYNEIDPACCETLRNLIAAGLIAPGDVDERSIADVTPTDLAAYDQAHFFAGWGLWSYALRLAGWPDDRSVWTGSCPCQPFSSAGKRKGNADERHLWPEFYRLIRERRPVTVFGEQVEGAVRLGWLDGVCRDLEAEGYACGAHVLGAHSVGAPHIRQRLYWLADLHAAGHPAGLQSGDSGEHGRPRGLADAGSAARERNAGELPAPQAGVGGAGSVNGYLSDRLADGSQPDRLAHAQRPQRGADEQHEQLSGGREQAAGGPGGDGHAGGVEHAPRDGRDERRAESGGRGAASGCESCGMGDTKRTRPSRLRNAQEREPGSEEPASGCEPCGVGDVGNDGRRGDESQRRPEEGIAPGRAGAGVGRLGDANQPGLPQRGSNGGVQREAVGAPARQAVEHGSNPWSRSMLIPCRDGKTRRIPEIESVLRCLADGHIPDVLGLLPEEGYPLAGHIDGRAQMLKAIGNAIVAPVAAEFIAAYMECQP